MYSFEVEEDTDGNNFAGIEISIFALLDGTDFVVYHAKEPSNNLFGSHKVMLLFALLTRNLRKDGITFFIL